MKAVQAAPVDEAVESVSEDLPTIRPGRGQMNDLRSACGAEVSNATLITPRAELDSLRSLTVSLSENGEPVYHEDEPLPLVGRRLGDDDKPLTGPLSTRMAISVSKLQIAGMNGAPSVSRLGPPPLPSAKAMLNGPKPRRGAPKGAKPQGRPAARGRLIDRFGTPVLVAVSAVGLALFAGLVTKGDGPSAASQPYYEPATHAEETAATPAIPGTEAPVVAEAMEVDDTGGTPAAQPVAAAAPMAVNAAIAPTTAPMAARAASPIAAAAAAPATPAAAPAANAVGRCEDQADQGAAFASKGNYAAAEASYKATLLCNGGYFPARMGLADAVWAQGNHPRAAAMYRDIVDSLPSDMVPARARERSGTPSVDTSAAAAAAGTATSTTTTTGATAPAAPAASDTPFAKEL